MKGKSLLNDNYPTILIRLGETAQNVPDVGWMCSPGGCVCMCVCVYVFTSHTQSDPYNLYYIALGVLKEANGLTARPRIQAF